jgi:hypothetical protein
MKQLVGLWIMITLVWTAISRIAGITEAPYDQPDVECGSAALHWLRWFLLTGT